MITKRMIGWLPLVLVGQAAIDFPIRSNTYDRSRYIHAPLCLMAMIIKSLLLNALGHYANKAGTVYHYTS